MIEISSSLLQSLIHSPLLITDLPEAQVFPHDRLSLPKEISPLNLEQKLGHLYEDALAQLLESSDEFDLLAQNLQVQKDQHSTLGELDFLIRDHSNDQLIHLELATKFYLAVPTENGLTLPGPDARDNFFKKLDRLRFHQLQLTTLHKEHLPEKFRNESIETQQLIYGCLFDHISSQTPASPEFIAPNCRRGKWLTSEEVYTHFPSENEFQIIPKSLWPAPLNLLNQELETWSAKDDQSRCVMVCRKDDPFPYFIAPNNYPSP